MAPLLFCGSRSGHFINVLMCATVLANFAAAEQRGSGFRRMLVRSPSTGGPLREDPVEEGDKLRYKSHYTLDTEGSSVRKANVQQLQAFEQKASRASLSEQITAVQDAIERNARQWPGKDPKGMLAAAVSDAKDGGAQMRARLRRRYKEGSAFVFAALGSSVTAGHDNYANQSWPFQLAALLQPAFKSAGFDFEVRNRAFGGWGEMPFASGCLKERVGDDVDALNWEWDMFHDQKCEVQHFLWEVNDLERRPVLFMFEDAALRYDATTPANNHLGVSEKRRARLKHNDQAFDGGTRVWHPAEWYLGEEFVSAAEVDNWKREGSTSTLEDDGQDHGNPTAVFNAASDFPMLTLYPFKTSSSSRFVRGDPWYESREKAFNINWHPGPLGHHFVASQLSHYFLTQLLLALQEEEQGTAMPPPPFGPSGKPCGMAKKKCYTGVEPFSSNALPAMRARDSKDNWAHAISLNQEIGPGPMQQSQLDMRRVYRGTAKDGELQLVVQAEGETPSYAVVCGAPCGWRCEQHTGYVSANTDKWFDNKQRAKVSDLAFTVNGNEVPSEKLLQLHNELFGPLGNFCPGDCKAKDICQPVANLEPGTHTVGMRVRPLSKQDPDMFVELLQVMLVGEA